MDRPSNGRQERRRSPRYAVDQPALLVPVSPDGRPDWGHRLLGVVRDVSAEGMGLEFSVADESSTLAFIVGVTDPQGTLRFEGLEVRSAHLHGRDRVRIGGRFGGLSHDILCAANLKPTFDTSLLKFTLPFSEELLQRWAELGLLQRVLEDQVQLCPRCQALPSFRPGCPTCGSARLATDQFIHHFACAVVAPVADFLTETDLVCPKCKTRHLVVGSDFEYLHGANHCLDCHWGDTELEYVGQCLSCHLRFPGYQAFTLELYAYHANRLDPLALVAQS
jgi:hypothetical protein